MQGLKAHWQQLWTVFWNTESSLGQGGGGLFLKEQKVWWLKIVGENGKHVVIDSYELNNQFI